MEKDKNKQKKEECPLCEISEEAIMRLKRAAKKEKTKEKKEDEK